MNQYLLMISMDGRDAVPCLPSGEHALGLNCEGISWLEAALVSIRCDAQNELSVRAEGELTVTLERAGRRLSLGAREIRLLPQDVICFGGHRFEIVSMRRYREVKRRFSSRQAMLSAAAAFALVAVPACQPKNAGYPETPPVVDMHKTGKVAPQQDEAETELQNLKDAQDKAEDAAQDNADEIEKQEVFEHPMGDVVFVPETHEEETEVVAPEVMPRLGGDVAPMPSKTEPEANGQEVDVPKVAPRLAGAPKAPTVEPACHCKDGETCDCKENGKPCGCQPDVGEIVKRPEAEVRLSGKKSAPVVNDH